MEESLKNAEEHPRPNRGNKRGNEDDENEYASTKVG